MKELINNIDKYKYELIDNILCINGDCLEVMKDIQEKSIDCILTDPSFQMTDCNWDKIIPIDKMWNNINKIIKEKSVVCIFGKEPFASLVRCGNLNNYKYDWIWIKNNCLGFAHSKNKPMGKYENIMVFSPNSIGHLSLLGNKRMTYNPQGVIAISKEKKVNRSSNVYGCREKQNGKVYTAYTNLPNDLLYFNKDKEKLHPTQKPVALLEYLVKTYTNENDLILDFTAGSGTTGIACLKTNRKCILIEKGENYYNMMVDRIKEEGKQGVLL